VDISYEARAAHPEYVEAPVEQPDLSILNSVMGSPPEPDPNHVGKLPPGWMQIGSVVLPEDVALGLAQVGAEAAPPWEEIPGNAYPRKHTLYLNFIGGMLTNGADNSAENKSTLAKYGEFPTYGGGETQAIAVAQAVAADVANYGIRVVYHPRPSKTLPYTMVMVGGSWTDVNIESPAGGVAPGADCEAHGQRHVAYAFGNAASSTISQEAGHAWGLDHTTNGASVMSYSGGSNKGFSSTCDPLCEEACQGPGSIGCRTVHEKHCGEGSGQQNEDAELTFIFGGNEPDMEPPVPVILRPEDGTDFPEGEPIHLRVDVTDNYGGFGWKFILEQAGEGIIYEAVDYEKDLGFDLSKIPAGTYTFTLEAMDHFDHVATDVVHFTVAGGGVATSGDASSGEMMDTGTTDTGTTDTSPTATSDPDESTGGSGEISAEASSEVPADESDGSDAGTTEGIDGPDSRGCGCRAGTAGIDLETVGALSWLLFGAHVGRRRKKP